MADEIYDNEAIYLAISKREKWDRRYLEMAGLVAGWSRDPSSQIGAVIVRPDKTIASVGFNGLARGLDDTPERYLNREFKLATILHAEENAILNAKEPIHGYTIYVSGLPPCAKCASFIIQSGLKRVVAWDRPPPERWKANMELSLELLAEASVKVGLISVGV